MCDSSKATEKLWMREGALVWLTLSSGFGDMFDPPEIPTVMKTEVSMLLIFLLLILQWRNNRWTFTNGSKDSKMCSVQVNQVNFRNNITQHHIKYLK